MGSVEDHLMGGTVDISAGDVKGLRQNLDGLVGIGTAANPVTVKLSAGVYTLDRPLALPNYCTLIGAGRDATIIQRTLAATNTSHGTDYCDPVIDAVSSTGVILSDMTVKHTGVTDSTITATTKNPIAIWSSDALRFKMSNVRAEGSYSGWYPGNGFVDGSYTKPIPGNVIGNEDYQIHINNCIIIGHSQAAVYKSSRAELFATGCMFLCDIRASDVLQSTTMPAAFTHWEYTIGHYKSCHFIMRSAQTLIASVATEAAAAFTIKDTAITDTVAYCDDCTFYLDLGDGDINSALSGGCSVYVGGRFTSGSTLYPSNVFKADNCRFQYETGTITSAPYICGLYLESITGVSTAVDAYLNSCTFEDIAGSGGTRRRDVVIPATIVSAQARKLEVRNCNIQDYDYRVLSGSPTFAHANFMTEPNTMNYQRSSVAFSPSGTSVAVTLPLAYTASGGITDYAVFLEPNENNTFWVSSKTNSGFTLNANAATAGTIRFVVRR